MKINLRNAKINMALIWMLVALLLPTSISNTQIMTSWTTIYYLISIFIFALLLLPLDSMSIKIMGWQMVGIAILVVCTFMTLSFKNGFVSEWGCIIQFLCIAIMYAIRINNYNKISKTYDKLFILICIVFLIAGLLVVFGNQDFKDFLNMYFTQHREYGTYVATERGKPVGTFVQHSISALMYYLMIILLYFRNKKKKSIINNIMITGFIFLIYNLKSFTALSVLILLVVLLFIDTREGKTIKSIIFRGIIVVVASIALIIGTNYINEIMSSDVNGLAGRFAGTSVFLQNFTFLKNNILPIGVTNSKDLWLTDCGYIVNLIKGGIVFVVIIYGGLIYFVWKNVINKKIAFALLLGVLLFEIGYPILLEFRFIAFLPFYIFYSNYLTYNENI